MSIIKNEIPILEFDSEQEAVINPARKSLGLNLPEKCVFAFLGDYIDEYVPLLRWSVLLLLHVQLSEVRPGG